jgi:uncharacterized 2Fe-2S/4Fe-4S cluster protein (DUF4445 family)
MQRSFKVVFQPDGKRGNFPEGTSLLEAARSLGVDINSICGGTGACGKCIVKINSGIIENPSETDKKFIDRENLKNGFRLACLQKIKTDLVITVPKESRTGTQRLQTEGLETIVEMAPLVSKRVHGDVVEILYEDKVVREVDSTDAVILGFAVDIGSTKIAGYLMDLDKGGLLSTVTAMNPQIPYGEDIISRIASAIQSEEKKRLLHETLVKSIRQLLEEACRAANQSIKNVYDIVLVGNTAMQHFLLGISPEPLSRNPFMPENLEHRDLKPETLNLNLYGGVHVLPLIAGFIGADCVAATLATGIDKTSQMSFLMDIGTNTEILVGSKNQMIACSCASGPAFEGAHIQYGMRAASGAIEGVWIEKETLEPKIKVIEDTSPLGICGSGLIDLLSEMLKAGIMDSSGRLIERDHPRLKERASVREYIVSRKKENGLNEDIVITQKDIRELQKGKAAIFSGAQMTMNHLGLDPYAIKQTYIAGAFGTYINRESAINIGMIPEFKLLDIQQVGNAAGTGARMALLSRKARKEAQRIRERVEYIELANLPEYNQAYIDALQLPHHDLSLFPETVERLEESGWIKGRHHNT